MKHRIAGPKYPPPEQPAAGTGGRPWAGSRGGTAKPMHQSCRAVAFSPGCGASARAMGVVIAADAPGATRAQQQACAAVRAASGPNRSGQQPGSPAPRCAAPAQIAGRLRDSPHPPASFAGSHAGRPGMSPGSSMQPPDRDASSRDCHQVIAGPWCARPVTVFSWAALHADLRNGQEAAPGTPPGRRAVSSSLGTGRGGLRQGARASASQSPALVWL